MKTTNKNLLDVASSILRSNQEIQHPPLPQNNPLHFRNS